MWIHFCEYCIAFDTKLCSVLQSISMLLCAQAPKGYCLQGPKILCLLVNGLCYHSAAQRRTELQHCITKRCGTKPVTAKAAHRNLERSSKGCTDRCNSRDLWKLKTGLEFGFVLLVLVGFFLGGEGGGVLSLSVMYSLPLMKKWKLTVTAI